jgi:CHAT domain-containing protein
MMITNADDKQNDLTQNLSAVSAQAKPNPEPRPATAIAERLRFVHVGQRARAETILHQRQPGLVESLVARQIEVHDFQAEFCRTLFQLMVPQEFKDAARQLDRIALVVDGYSANLPWELMLADEEPLAVRARIIRQLSSTVFRRQVRQTLRPFAYVVGNPGTDNFFKTFPHPNALPTDGLDSLTGAEQEAEVAAHVLSRHGYQVETAIGQTRKALDVITPLYQTPYRIVHIAAHGIFDERAADGVGRTGVVLSDGLVLGAAEISQMEIVPDLVFLNCCHLAQSNPTPVPYNRLAYSISRELIEIGVRCVVAAGWAVDDDAAYTFAETFYHCLLQDKLPFGDAVFEARKETYRKHGSSSTWGAYQAYGDPGWRVDPRAESSPATQEAGKFVALEELIDHIDQIRMRIYRRRESMTKSDAKSIAADLKQLLGRAPRKWLDQPVVIFELAQTYTLLGIEYFEEAAKLYSAAIAGEDQMGRVPIAAIEQLIDVESRLAESNGDPRLVERAIARLGHLYNTSVGSMDNETLDTASWPALNAERASSLGGAYKRKAAIFARRIVAGDDARANIDGFDAAVRASIAAYEIASGKSNEERFDPYPALNWLALKALEGDYKQGIADCLVCASKANERFQETPDVWNAVMSAEAYLVECLCHGGLGSDDREAVLAQVHKRYADALTNIQFAPKDIDTLTQQLCLLALFFEARAATCDQASRAKTNKIIAQSLCCLADQIKPGSCNLPEPPGELRAKRARPGKTGRRGKRRGK